jgi:hypothetical protein
VAVGSAARAVVVVAAVSGLGIVALVVTFLFSLYGSYQRREVQVVTLQAAAGAPPSAVTLLETYARLELVGRLPGLFAEWERWAAEVLDTHVAYPLLGFFRSSHDNLSWISALGTVLDAASLVLDHDSGSAAWRSRTVQARGHAPRGGHQQPGFSGGDRRHSPAWAIQIGLGRNAFDLAYARLAGVGYDLVPGDAAWREFEAARAAYASRLQAMADYWATPTNSWLDSAATSSSPVHSPDESAD